MPKRKPSGNTRTKIFALIVLVLAMILYYSTEKKTIVTNAGKTFVPTEDKFADTGVSIKYDYDSQGKFYSYGTKDFYFCTKDGVKLMSSDGNPKWDSVFNLLSPIMVGEGDKVAVADSKGKNIYVYSQNGLLYDLKFQYPIYSFSINTIGYLSVILQQNNAYEALVYNEMGKVAWHFKHEDYNICPINSDISNDGKIVLNSLLDTNNVDMVSRLMFAHVNEEDSKSDTDTIFGSTEKKSQIVAPIKFMTGNNLITFSDSEVSNIVFSEDSTGKTIWSSSWSSDLNNKIERISFLDDKSFAMVLGESLINKQDSIPWRLQFYSINGRVGEYNVGRKVTFLSAGHNSAIVGVGRDFYAVNSKGNLMWEYKATHDVRQLIFLENTDTVLMVTGTEASVMRRTKSKENTDKEPVDRTKKPGPEAPATTEAPVATENPAPTPVTDTPEQENEDTE